MIGEATAQPTPFAGKRQQLLISIRDGHKGITRVLEDLDEFNGSLEVDAESIKRLEAVKTELRNMAGTVVIG
jgi:hypothetical protein